MAKHITIAVLIIITTLIISCDNEQNNNAKVFDFTLYELFHADAAMEYHYVANDTRKFNYALPGTREQYKDRMRIEIIDGERLDALSIAFASLGYVYDVGQGRRYGTEFLDTNQYGSGQMFPIDGRCVIYQRTPEGIAGFAAYPTGYILIENADGTRKVAYGPDIYQLLYLMNAGENASQTN